MTVRRSAKSYNVKTCQSCGAVATNVGISRLFSYFYNHWFKTYHTVFIRLTALGAY